MKTVLLHSGKMESRLLEQWLLGEGHELHLLYVVQNSDDCNRFKFLDVTKFGVQRITEQTGTRSPAIDLAIGHTYAQAIGAECLAIGANLGDTGNWQLRNEYLRQMQTAFFTGPEKVTILRPFIGNDSLQLVINCAARDFDFQSMDCHDTSKLNFRNVTPENPFPHCGRCNGCLRRKGRIARGGIVDKTPYQNL
jgi:hypothetical protein